MDGQKENLATLDDSSPWIFFLVVSQRRKKISLRWYNQWNKTEESSSGENSFAQFTPGQTLCLGNDDACCLLFGWSKTLSWTLTLLLSSLRCNRREEKKNLQLNYHHFVTICFCACKEARRLPFIWLPKNPLLWYTPYRQAVITNSPMFCAKIQIEFKLNFAWEKMTKQTTKSFLDFKAFGQLRSLSQNANQDKKRERFKESMLRMFTQKIFFQRSGRERRL